MVYLQFNIMSLLYKYYQQIKKSKSFIFRGITEQLFGYSKVLDPCAVFLALPENLHESMVDLLLGNINFDIDNLLTINGLPTKDVLNKEILIEMAALNIKLEDGPYSNLYKIQKKNGMEL